MLPRQHTTKVYAGCHRAMRQRHAASREECLLGLPRVEFGPLQRGPTEDRFEDCTLGRNTGSSSFHLTLACIVQNSAACI
jgi:hypothetical protein